MTNINDLILYENENTALDFKKIQYQKVKFPDLIKDIMAMANAKVSTDRYIIVGVLHQSNGNRDLLGIGEEFIDSAIYHQLIRENIEPEIHFEYVPHRFGGKLFGIFRIFACDDRPYMMRKDNERLRKGDCFIRKGTHQDKITRSDIDEIIVSRAERGFTSKISVSFNESGFPNLMEVKTCSSPELPSKLASEEIESVLEKRKREIPKTSYLNSFPKLNFQHSFISPFGTTYNQRSTETLIENLKKVHDTYLDDNLYYIYEERSERINFSLLNEGKEFVEDLLVIFRFPKIDGLLIAPRIYNKPQETNVLLGRYPTPGNLDNLHYPTVKITTDFIEVTTHIKKLRHGIRDTALDKDLRIFFREDLSGQEIKILCIITGKQLRIPRQEQLIIKIK